MTEGRSADSLGYRRVGKGQLALTFSGAVHDAVDYLWLREVGKVKGAVEAEDLKAVCTGGQAQAVIELPKGVVRSPALVGGAIPTEAVCSGGAALRFTPAKAGDRCDVPFDVKESGDLGLTAAWLQAADQGSAKVLVDGRPAGSVDCRAEPAAVGARYGLGTWRLNAGQHKLSLVANEAKPVTLDYLLLKPAQRGHEAECLIPLGEAARTMVVKERFGAEPKWSGGAYVKVTAQAGRPVRFGLVAPRAGRYKARVVEAKVPAGVAARASIGGQPFGTLDSNGAGEALGKGAEASLTMRGGLNELALAPQAAGDLALDVVELTYVGRPRWQQAAALALLLVLIGGGVVALRRRRRAS
ncbi:MAG: hypothetical protein HZB16_01470 [Armatimonadetes bacterium]|nr:hypothetical protein [Armatimonadota bacterium]